MSSHYFCLLIFWIYISKQKCLLQGCFCRLKTHGLFDPLLKALGSYLINKGWYWVRVEEHGNKWYDYVISSYLDSNSSSQTIWPFQNNKTVTSRRLCFIHTRVLVIKPQTHYLLAVCKWSALKNTTWKHLAFRWPCQSTGFWKRPKVDCWSDPGQNGWDCFLVFQKNGLVLNHRKTNVLQFYNTKRPNYSPLVKINGSSLEMNHVTKYLLTLFSDNHRKFELRTGCRIY